MKKWLKITLTLLVIIGLTVALYLIGFKGDWIKPIIDYSSFDIFEWFVFINLAIIDVLLVWKLSTKVEQWIRMRRMSKEERDDTDQ